MVRFIPEIIQLIEISNNLFMNRQSQTKKTVINPEDRVNSTRPQPLAQDLTNRGIDVRGISPPKGKGGITKPVTTELKATKLVGILGKRQMFIALRVIHTRKERTFRDMTHNVRQGNQGKRRARAEKVDSLHG